MPAKNSPFHPGTKTLLQRYIIVEAETGQEKMWLQAMKDACYNDNLRRSGTISWAAYCAHKQPVQNVKVTRTASPLPLLSLLSGNDTSCYGSCEAIVNKLNPGQVLVITFDQPLYAFIDMSLLLHQRIGVISFVLIHTRDITYHRRNIMGFAIQMEAT